MNQEVRVTIIEIVRSDNGKPVCDRNPYHCTMRRDEKFMVIFEKWHKEKQPDTPLKDIDFLYFKRRDDQPDTGMQSGGGMKGAQKVKGDQTPEQLHMPNEVRLYAKRDDLECDLNEEPQQA